MSPRSNTRRRPLEDISDSESDLGRKRQKKTNPLVSKGKHFTRVVDMFTTFPKILEVGMRYGESLLDDPSGTLSVKDARALAGYCELMKMCPKLEEKLGDEVFIMDAKDALAKGRSNARSDDTGGLKKMIIEWIDPVPSIPRNQKATRGFHHPTTGQLLCPIHLDWSDEETRIGLRDGTIKTKAEEWPAFLYANNKANDDNLWEGLFRNTILVKATQFIFTSPSSVGSTEASTRATKSSNAALHSMEQMTFGAIAYIATQVRFALSSEETFVVGNRSGFDHVNFYRGIVSFLESEKDSKECKLLMAWWNRQIFRHLNEASSLSANNTAQRIASQRPH